MECLNLSDNPYFSLYRTKFQNISSQQQISEQNIQTLLEQFALVHNCSIQMFYDVTQVISVLFKSIEEKENKITTPKTIDFGLEKNQSIEKNKSIEKNDGQIENKGQRLQVLEKQQDPNSSSHSNYFNSLDYFQYKPQTAKSNIQRLKQFQNQKKPKTKLINAPDNVYQPKKIKLDNIYEEDECLKKSINQQEEENQMLEEKKQTTNKAKVYKIQFDKDDSQLSQDHEVFKQIQQTKKDNDIPLLQQQTLDRLWDNKSKEHETSKQEEKPARQVHKKKSERQIMKGHKCDKCEKFYQALGLNNSENQQLCQCASRHRYDYPLPSTPDIFYNDDTFI